jgi:hypothetical protein
MDTCTLTDLSQTGRDIGSENLTHENSSVFLAHQLVRAKCGIRTRDLHGRQLRIGSDETHVGAEADLGSAAKGHAVHGRNYRDGYLALDRHRLLSPVGVAGRLAVLQPRCTR